MSHSKGGVSSGGSTAASHSKTNTAGQSAASSASGQSSGLPSVGGQSKSAVNTGPVAVGRYVSAPHDDKTGRYLLVMRHGERVDRIFPSWIKCAFRRGVYEPYDLNLPLKVPKRPFQEFDNDAPLTEFGSVSAQMVGRAMRVSRAVPKNRVYTSPALRCVQSAQNVVKALGLTGVDAVIKIEPALFEWLGWYDSTPRWLTQEQLVNSGYPVDIHYKPVLTMDELLKHKQESSAGYYERSSAALEKILASQSGGGVILIVGHAPTIDACCRPLLGHTTKRVTRPEMDKTGVRYPYSSIVSLEEMKTGKWRLMHDALKPITSLDHNNRIDLNYFNRDA